MRVNWRKLLIAIFIDWPATIVTVWWLAYRIFLMVVTMITVTVVIAMLVLQCFGVRWGW